MIGGTYVGIWVAGSYSRSNRVLGNCIGLGSSGTPILNDVGVYVEGGHSNAIGGRTAGARNVIAATDQGVCCATAILIRNGAWPCVGNLANASAADDGGNTFRRGNARYIANRTANRIRAEGCDFVTTSRAQIADKILDHADNPAYGVVDFSPLIGGVIPSGEAVSAPGVVLAATCRPTRAGGAEVILSLSAEAAVSVEVLNIAGRRVRQLLLDKGCNRGVLRTSWDGRSDAGLRVPNGPYLVRATARDRAGSQASTVATVAVTH